MSNATVKFAQTKSCEKHFTHVTFYSSYLHINKLIKVEKKYEMFSISYRTCFFVMCESFGQQLMSMTL